MGKSPKGLKTTYSWEVSKKCDELETHLTDAKDISTTLRTFDNPFKNDSGRNESKDKTFSKSWVKITACIIGVILVILGIYLTISFVRCESINAFC